MSPRPTLSAVLIVKNEADNLAECLATLDWVDEIIVLDSGSTDNTKAIALAANAHFYVNAEWPGFGKQRQLAQSYVSSDWILWVDADERVTPELKASIEAVLATPTTDTVYTLPRLSWAFGRFIRHCGWYPDRVLRLYPTQLTTYNDALVHEKVIVGDHIKIKHLSGDLLHYTYKDLEHYLTKSAHYAAAWSKQRQHKGKSASLSQGVLHGIGCFLRMYVLKAGFLDGKQGFLLSVLSAHSTFVKYADLWVNTQTHEPKKPH